MRVLRSRTPQVILVGLFVLGLITAYFNSSIGLIILNCAVFFIFYSVARASTEYIILISLWMFFGPLIISAFIFAFLYTLTPDFVLWIGDGTIIFLSIPLISITYSLAFLRVDGFTDRIKISLKINNIIIVIITFWFVWYAFSIEDFSTLIPSIEELRQYDLGPREFIIFVLQVITFPYIIANLLSDAIIDVTNYRRRNNIHNNS